MKKLILIMLLFLIPLNIYAGRGCCSHHGGECGCNANGRSVCCDGTLSPSCRCTPPVIYGCTDYNADNYNPNANQNDGSCMYTVYGCTDSKAKNYNSAATKNDGSCEYDVFGCTDKLAINYNSLATVDDGNCEYKKGCMDLNALNYDVDAKIDDGSCIYKQENVIKTDNDKSSNNLEKDEPNVIPGILILFMGGFAIRKFVGKKK